MQSVWVLVSIKYWHPQLHVHTLPESGPAKPFHTPLCALQLGHSKETTPVGAMACHSCLQLRHTPVPTWVYSVVSPSSVARSYVVTGLGGKGIMSAIVRP